MKWWIYTLVLIGFMGWSAQAEPLVRPHLSDSEISRRLVGVWINEQKGFRGEFIYRTNGTCVCYLDPASFLMRLVANPYYFEGTWQVRDGLIIFDVKKSNTKAIPVGTKYRNEILKLEPKVFITRNDKKLVTEFVRGQATVRTKQKY